MVLGNGLIASRFKTYSTLNEYIIFASGVSNSKSLDLLEYEREIKLLDSIFSNLGENILVYFSTCSIYDLEESESLYVQHKLQIEKLIQEKAANFYIFRISNLAGNTTNPNTILNYLYYHIANKINFNLWINASRNIIDIDDMYKIADYILQKRILSNQIINIANPQNNKVAEIILEFESVLNLKANYIKAFKGNEFSINISMILQTIKESNVLFGEKYLRNIIRKYYLPQ